MRLTSGRWPALVGLAAMTANLIAPAFAPAFAAFAADERTADSSFAPGRHDAAEAYRTATPIKHLVVIYDENVSFDHYFGTYPKAANVPGEPPFYPAPFTPQVNNLLQGNLLYDNPNLDQANGTGTYSPTPPATCLPATAPATVPPTCPSGASNPFRLDRTQASTTDQNHDYMPEQQAFDGGDMNLFPKYTGSSGTAGAGTYDTAAIVMGYFDGNTVTALWNYAQHFAMSQNGHGSAYGPSTPGALEAVSGQTNGITITEVEESASGSGVVGPTITTDPTSLLGSIYVPDGQGSYTDISDINPAGDVCTPSTPSTPAAGKTTSETYASMSGDNIGDLLNEYAISWGGFMGGFNLELTNSNGTTGCSRSTTSAVTDETESDYIEHHNWFMYYASTANPTHARPSSLAAIGHTLDSNGQVDPANHEYDVNDFFAAVQAGNFPAVAYLKAPGYEDGHAGYSDPIDEQNWIVEVVNFIEQQPEWRDTAIIIDWDDSDGWYDHAFVAPTNPSSSSADALYGPSNCGTGTPLADIEGRCGPGPRLPFMVISPYAKANYVSDTLITQSSIVRFIEDNWLNGERLGGGSFDATAGSIMDMFDFYTPYLNPPLFLDGATGEPVDKPGPLPSSVTATAGLPAS